jgi:formylglycine-generating enzyme required for sulfatase activity
MSDLPVIILAFANEQEGRRYLRDLPQELRKLSAILAGAETKRLCRPVVLPNATLDDIFAAFTTHRDRVVAFHYAGHADSARLLLESASGGGDGAANAAGVATFLGQCHGLQLVFLNGCSTRGQAARLLGVGVAAVIATARAIEDSVARDFAAAFYTELVAGFRLRAAYEASRGRILAAHGEATTNYYQNRELLATAREPDGIDAADDNGFPWEFRPGTELVERWSLPDAAGNPLLGLPAVPERDLPESPFRHLAWFTADHAEVFFGRGYQIRELYEELTERAGSPIVLLYGATGVGKSSLLDAGLAPRLKAGGHEIRYCRRDAKRGLLSTLAGALESPSADANLGDAWRALEAKMGRPLVILLDQVEEAYTRTETVQPREVDEMVAALVSAFRVREARPLGKLVLGFRKEWFAEIDRRLAEAGLDRSKFFLKPLDRRGVVEAVVGPARPGRLQKRYRLHVEDGLAEQIADDLVADAGSALASTLQVLLSKMWERVKDSDTPVFSRDLYKSLKASGYLLKDVLDQGLSEVGLWNPEVLTSGLILDVLCRHATDLGTAAQVSRAELDECYAHRLDVLDDLVDHCKDQYLLIEADPVPGASGRTTRMAHDLLAPLVLQRFRLSVASGQRARRLLENRATDWAEGKVGPVLDRTDLTTVLAGGLGMRAWTPDETRLVEASVAQDERLKAREAEEQRRLKEAEEGLLKAEAQARQEAERRLDEQAKANEQQIQANSRLADANQRQRQTLKHLRLAAYALGTVAAVVIGVAGVAFYESSLARQNLDKFKSEVNRRALVQAKGLLDADPQAVPELLNAVRGSDDAMKNLQTIRLTPVRDAKGAKKRARAALALLAKNPAEAEFLLGHVLEPDSDPQELLLVRQNLAPHLSANTKNRLWKTMLSSKVKPDLLLRNAAVLAGVDDKDPRWSQSAKSVVANILSVDALQLGDWTDAFRGVRGRLIGPLVNKFKEGEPIERKVAATILNSYADDDIALLVELLKDADAEQFAILFQRATANREAAVKAMTEEVAFELLKDANVRQFPILVAKAKDDPAAAAKSMRDEVAKKPRPKSSFAQKDKLASRQTNALITLALLGQPESLWPSLRHAPDPRRRTYLIQRMGALGVDYKLLAGRLFAEKDPSIRAAIVLGLGEYPYNSRVTEINALVADRLLAEYARDPDPGLHSAIAWVLTGMGRLEQQEIDEQLAGKAPGPNQLWFVNKQGQTFVILKNPGVFLMGSPDEETSMGKTSKEQQHHRRIPRSFAISTREVTVAEYFRFLQDPAAKDVSYLEADQRDYSPHPRGPIVSVTWFEAAKYCRWLSDIEGVPESEKCYPPIAEIKEGMVLERDYLTRSGYRLPTEAEWEHACRGGTQTPWVFGSDKSLLREFGWHLNNSTTKNIREQAQETGLKKPNAFGLFDMHGNVYEWCSDRGPEYPATDGDPVDDLDNESPDRRVMDADVRIYRGGSFADLPLNLRSAYRDSARPTNRFPAVGFRVARTYSTK